jgi:RNA polymerase sigma factor (sigma-70 family)
MSDDRSDYERLIVPIEQRMIRTVWRITRDPADAEDAFQDALLTVWKRWGRVRKHPNPHALVLRICINAAFDLLRRKARDLQVLETGADAEHIPDSSPSIFQEMSRAEQGTEVLRAVGRLSRNQAQALLMRAVEDVPYDDIAQAMNCREVTVRKHVARARAKLSTLLSHLVLPAREEDQVND